MSHVGTQSFSAYSDKIRQHACVQKAFFTRMRPSFGLLGGALPVDRRVILQVVSALCLLVQRTSDAHRSALQDFRQMVSQTTSNEIGDSYQQYAAKVSARILRG